MLPASDQSLQSSPESLLIQAHALLKCQVSISSVYHNQAHHGLFSSVPECHSPLQTQSRSPVPVPLPDPNIQYSCSLSSILSTSDKHMSLDILHQISVICQPLKKESVISEKETTLSFLLTSFKCFTEYRITILI